LIDLSGLSGRSPLADFDAINRELELFDAELAARPQVVVGNKIDLAESRENLPALTQELADRGLELISIAAATGEGIRDLVAQLCQRVAAIEKPRQIP
jgi:GTP-binding protein